MAQDQVKLNLKITHYIFLALLAGQFLFMIFAWIVAGSRSVFFHERLAGNILYQILPFLILGMGLLAWYLGKWRSQKGKSLKSEELKIHHFRDTALMQAIIMEGGNIFAIMTGLLTFSYLPYLFFAVGLVIYLWFYPSEARFRKDYF